MEKESAILSENLVVHSIRRVEDISEAIWGTAVLLGTISDLNKKAYDYIEMWRRRSLTGFYPYIYVVDVYLKAARRGMKFKTSQCD